MHHVELHSSPIQPSWSLGTAGEQSQVFSAHIVAPGLGWARRSHVPWLCLSPFPLCPVPSRKAERPWLLSTFLWLSFTKAPNVSCVGFVPVFGGLPSVPSPVGHSRLMDQTSFPSMGRNSRAPSTGRWGCLSPSPRYLQAGHKFHHLGQSPTRKGVSCHGWEAGSSPPHSRLPSHGGAVVSTRRPRCARSRPPAGGGCGGAWGGAGGSGGTCC